MLQESFLVGIAVLAIVIPLNLWLAGLVKKHRKAARKVKHSCFVPSSYSFHFCQSRTCKILQM